MSTITASAAWPIIVSIRYRINDPATRKTIAQKELTRAEPETDRSGLSASEFIIAELPEDARYPYKEADDAIAKAVWFRDRTQCSVLPRGRYPGKFLYTCEVESPVYDPSGHFLKIDGREVRCVWKDI